MVDRRREAFEAGLKNPLMGDIGPLQRLYGTVSAIGSELGGGDMGTPFGQRFGESQKATKAEIKRLQELRAKHPEEFGRGMMLAADVQDPYMFGLGLGSVGGMRPMGTTTFSPIEGPQRIRQGAGVAAEAEAPRAAPGIGYAPRPAEPYYRNVPPEMGTSPGPMNAYNQNMYGMSTGRYGPAGAQYAPEMAVTDFETYGPGGMGRTGPESWGRPLNKFDQNMYDAYVRGRAARGGDRPSMGGEYTLEELGSAPVPYRQGGLVYEPVVGQAQGAAPRQIGGPQGAPRLGYGRGPIEGEWSEVPPQGQIPYGMGYRPNFTMEGGAYTPGAQNMAVSPTGLRFDPRVAMGAAGLGYLEARRQMPSTPLSGSQAAPAAVLHNQVMPSDFAWSQFGDGAQGGGDRMNAMNALPAQSIPAQSKKTRAPQKSAEAPLPPRRPEGLGNQGWEGNLNYQVTQLLDRLTGQDQAEKGRQYQEYYATNPWPY